MMEENISEELVKKVVYINKKDMFPKFFRDLCNNEDEIYEIATVTMYDLVRSGRIKNNIPVIKKSLK